MHTFVSQVGIHTLIAAERFKTQDYYGMLLKVYPELEHSTPGDIQSKEYVALISYLLSALYVFKWGFHVCVSLFAKRYPVLDCPNGSH